MLPYPTVSFVVVVSSFSRVGLMFLHVTHNVLCIYTYLCLVLQMRFFPRGSFGHLPHIKIIF